MEEFTCNKCFIKKPSTEFHKNKNYSTGYNTVCKQCRNTYNKTYTQNKKKVTEQKLEKYLTYKLVKIKEQDAKKFPEHVNTLTVTDLINIYKKYEGRCVYSRKEVKPGAQVNIYSKLSFDRINNDLPHEKDNLQLTSVFINMMRGNMTTEKFEKLIAEYDN